MLRTRDLVLYVLVVLFLVIGITATWQLGEDAPSIDNVAAVNLINSGEEFGVAAEADTDNRQANIARLKEKIAAGEGDLSAAPPVFDSVDQIPDVEVDADVNDEVIPPTDLQCPATENKYSNLWPKDGVKFAVVEGSRILSYETYVEKTVGSSTVMSTSTNTFMQIPIAKVRSSTDTCLVDSVVAVTTTGEPIMNGSASQYYNLNEYALAGYALDGLPIYGPVTDTSTLDSCGGRTTQSGYQYHVRTDDSKILGCYAAKPTVPLSVI